MKKSARPTPKPPAKPAKADPRPAAGSKVLASSARSTAAKPPASAPSTRKLDAKKQAAVPPKSTIKPSTYGNGRPAAIPLKPTPPPKPAAKVPTAQPTIKMPTLKAPSLKPPVPAKPGTPGAPNKPASKPPVFKLPPLPSFKPTPKPEPVISAEKDLTTRHKTGHIKDRLVMMVPDPYWIHAVWEINHGSVLRAESALGPDWHGAKPILRLFDVTSTDTTSTSEAPLRDIAIHGGVSHWWIDVPQPPRSYRADVGYVSKRGQFYMLARSNVVTPPKAGASEILEDNAWVADVEKAGGPDRILSMSAGFETPSGPSQLKEFFQEAFKKPHKEGMFGGGAIPGKLKKFHFDLSAELIVTGTTEPNATVTLQNERVPLRPDGTFTMRFSLPDSRQIIPAVSTSADGLEEQTIVLAVERNIKRLDVMTHDMAME